MRKIIQAVLFCTILSPLVLPTLANQRKPARIQIPGMYSNMYYVKEAGDVVGMEIFIVSGGDGYYATVQIAEGAPNPPVVVKVQVQGSNIEFTLPNSSGVSLGKYKGNISARGLRGKFEGEEKSSFLKRRNSYWQ
jgi:hypothetical protein